MCKKNILKVPKGIYEIFYKNICEKLASETFKKGENKVVFILIHCGLGPLPTRPDH